MELGTRITKTVVHKDDEVIETGGTIIEFPEPDQARVRWDGTGGLKRSRILETVEWIKNLNPKD